MFVLLALFFVNKTVFGFQHLKTVSSKTGLINLFRELSTNKNYSFQTTGLKLDEMKSMNVFVHGSFFQEWNEAVPTPLKSIGKFGIDIIGFDLCGYNDKMSNRPAYIAASCQYPANIICTRHR